VFFVDKKIDLDKEDMNTMKVRDLRRALADLGGDCAGCTEKSEYIRAINKIRGKKEL
jgi:hypothetical protein